MCPTMIQINIVMTNSYDFWSLRWRIGVFSVLGRVVLPGATTFRSPLQMRLPATIAKTFFNGHLAWDNGKMVGTKVGKRLGFERG